MFEKILIIAGVICFGLAALGVSTRVDLGWLGAFCLALTLLI